MTTNGEKYISHSYRYKNIASSVSIDAGLWSIIQRNENCLFGMTNMGKTKGLAAEWLKKKIQEICSRGHKQEITQRLRAEMLMLIIDEQYMKGYCARCSNGLNKTYRIKTCSAFKLPSALDYALIMKMKGEGDYKALLDAAYKSAKTSMNKSSTPFIARHKLLLLVAKPQISIDARIIA